MATVEIEKTANLMTNGKEKNAAGSLPAPSAAGGVPHPNLLGKNAGELAQLSLEEAREILWALARPTASAPKSLAPAGNGGLPNNQTSDGHFSSLHAAELRYRALVDNIPAATFIAALDGEKHELYVSPQIQELLGYSQEEWLADPFLWYFRVHAEDRDRWGEEFARTSATGEPFKSEYRMLARDDRLIWIHAECRIVRDESGVPRFLQGIAWDVTDAKRAEHFLRQSNAELETRVQERTEELNQANQALRAEIVQRERIHRQLKQQNHELNRAGEELRRSRELAVHASLHDALTGLPNRVLLLDRISMAIERRRRQRNYHFALLYLDFDRFKAINDSLGHAIGDELLMAISKRLISTLRLTDSISAPSPSTAARIGGDEFVLLIDDLQNVRDAARVGDRLLKTLAEPYELRGHSVKSEVSIGITTSDVEYERTEDMLRDADTAMYQAKAAGKARYVFFDQKMHEDNLSRIKMENDLRGALERGELQLHYQPICSLATRALVGFEALVRWNHPQRGMVAPTEFIPLCEDTGLIVPIGEQVLLQGCRQLADWQKRIPAADSITVSMNFSAKQLMVPGIFERVRQIITESGVNPQSVILEITETAMIQNAAVAIPVMQRFCDLGLRLYMDDFGTGYSSLSCLHRFPLSGLKIDRSFIQSLTDRREYAAIVAAIAALARNLDMKLVGEGVESSEQVVILQTLECDAAQGYFFSPAINAADAEAFIIQHSVPQPALVRYPT